MMIKKEHQMTGLRLRLALCGANAVAFATALAQSRHEASLRVGAAGMAALQQSEGE